MQKLRLYLQKILSIRALNLYGTLIAFGLLATSAHFQWVMGLEPCPLCLVQRYVMLLIAIIFLLGAVYRGQRFIGLHAFVTLLIASFGGTVSGRQVWLQHLPADQVPACGPDLAYMFQHLPFWHAIQMLFQGTADCGEVQWTFFNLSIPEWTLGFFILFFCFAAINFIRSFYLIR